MDAFQDLKNLLKDPHERIGLGTISELELAPDRSVLRAKVSTWPDEIEIIARVAWDSIAPNAGVIMFPEVNDLVLFEYPDDEEDHAIITKTLSSKEDTIPKTAIDGSLVARARAGKKAWFTSDTRINLSKGDTEPAENLVLGQLFNATYKNHLTKLISIVEKLVALRETDKVHGHITIGLPSTGPTNSALMEAERLAFEELKTEIEDLKADDVDSEKFLSLLAYTEKGE